MKELRENCRCTVVPSTTKIEAYNPTCPDGMYYEDAHQVCIYYPHEMTRILLDIQERLAKLEKESENGA